MREGRAVQYDRYGGFDVVDVVRQERPTPGPGDIVVEVVSAGLNHIERFLREGKLRDHVELTFPAHQGTDFSGIVRVRGSEVRDLKVGDEVMGRAPDGGAHATWIRVPRRAVIKKPSQLRWEEAGGLYLAGATALSVVDSLSLGRDDTVVIGAAAGGVGHIQCQLARRAGAFVVALGSPRNHDYLRQIGTVPVAYGEGEEERIRQAANGRPITAFIDNHGESAAEELAERLGVRPERFVSSEERRDIELRFLRAPVEDEEARQMLERLAKIVQDRTVQVLISGFYPFEYIVDAYADLAQMKSRGKVVIGMQTVETGSRLGWYRSEKARDLPEKEAPARPRQAEIAGNTEASADETAQVSAGGTD
ncbi:Quinone oxidoreductase 1 [Frondihabitans sp. 762G35]|uniref:NADP-dependent oxidoreductase n=1 Tax=Frondihabitans sp. 762G35 TaxID=1446794 RepID=UPI000D229D03|nr:NADP-dependent oxidoreductase [Frondihabitans sp. 762G35]ARC58500.1 Quinone oxidoreductase 1 [Frondihabitans sp. 762G35]